MSTINLLPEDYVKMRMQRRVNILCMALFVVVVAGVAGAHYTTSQSFKHTRDIRDQIDQQYADATVLIQQMTDLESKKRSMLKKAETTSALVERVPRSTLLAVATNSRPEQMAILEMSLSTRKETQFKNVKSGVNKAGGSVLSKKSRQKAKGETKVKVEMIITGATTSDDKVGEYVNSLKCNPLIEAVDLDYTRQELFDDVPLRQFQVRLTLNQEVDAINVVNDKKQSQAPQTARGIEASEGDNS